MNQPVLVDPDIDKCAECQGFLGADILIVVDNSTSMKEEQEIIATRFFTLVNTLVAKKLAQINDMGSSEPTGSRMERGGILNLETGFAYETVRALMGAGHRIQFARGPYGGYQAVMRDPRTGVLTGASESRKDGHAAGF